MLRLVSKSDERQNWEHDYALDGQSRGEPAGYRDHFARPPPRKRSAFGRVAMTGLIALTLIFGGVAAYFAHKAGAFDGFLTRAPVQTAAPPSASSAAAPAQQQTAPAAAPSPIPDVPILVLLVRNAILSLHQANLTGNYAVFRAMAGPGLQNVTPAAIAEAFADLRSRNVDLGVVAAANPRLFAPPVINAQGQMELTGFFPGRGEQLNFTMSFEPVDGRWRLFGIGISPVPPAETASETITTPSPASGVIPADADLVGLIRGSVAALNQANITGDYAVLRDLGSPGFREANSATTLAESFAGLRARAIDLAPAAVIDPRLYRPAAIDAQGYLRLTGYFPSAPEQVNFDLAYAFHDGAWRLFGIGVNTSVSAPEAAAPAPASPTPQANPADGGRAPAPAAAAPAVTGPARTDATITNLPVPRLRPQIQGQANTP